MCNVIATTALEWKKTSDMHAYRNCAVYINLVSMNFRFERINFIEHTSDISLTVNCGQFSPFNIWIRPSVETLELSVVLMMLLLLSFYLSTYSINRRQDIDWLGPFFLATFLGSLQHISNMLQLIQLINLIICVYLECYKITISYTNL